MNSNGRQRKASKGTVQVKNSNDRLQLVFSYAGKRHYISLGLPDTKHNRASAEMRARQIELDIASGNFDSTLAKYKFQSAIAAPSDSGITPSVTPSAREMWEAYAQYKAPGLKETTRLYHASFVKLLERLGDTSVLDALTVKAGLEKITTVHQTKRVLMQLNAACGWAVRHGTIPFNPYQGMAKEMPKFRYQTEPKPNAFTEEERDLVLEAFRNHKGTWNGRGYAGKGYAHYAPFVEFLFLTGCRPSEAVGLQWKHVASNFDFVDFEGAVSYCCGKKIRVRGSKNNRERQVPCSDRLKILLQSIKPESCSPDALVFPSPTGQLMNYNNFLNGAWSKVVDPIRRGTTPYSCRDTFITLQILKRIPESVIARWCDTSVEMIQRYYVDFLRMRDLRPVD